jgi:hypothetical protein
MRIDLSWIPEHESSTVASDLAEHVPYTWALGLYIDRLKAYEPHLCKMIRQAFRQQELCISNAPSAAPAVNSDSAAWTRWHDAHAYYYQSHYYGPEICAESVLYQSFCLVDNFARHLLRLRYRRLTDLHLGLRLNFDGQVDPEGVHLADLLFAGRNSAAHFDEWVELDAPSSQQKHSWDVLQRFGYNMPLGNTTVIFDLFQRVSKESPEVFLKRMRGIGIDATRTAIIQKSSVRSPQEVQARDAR